MSMPHTSATRANSATKSTRTRLVAGIAAAATLLTAFAAGSSTYADGAASEAQVAAGSAQNSNGITPPPSKLGTLGTEPASPISARGASINATTSDIILLKGETTTAQPAEQTVLAQQFQRLGATGSFSVNASSLVAGNSITLATVSHTTTAPSGAKAKFVSGGTPAVLKTSSGDEVGTVQYDESLQALVLNVTQTSHDVGTETFSFSAQVLMVFNWPTDPTAMRALPYDNTISVRSCTNSTLTGTVRSYTFHINALSNLIDAIHLRVDQLNYNISSQTFNVYNVKYHEHIRSDSDLTYMNSNGGQVGALPENDVKQNFQINANNQSITPAYFKYELGVYYVSARNNKIQGDPGYNTPIVDEPSTQVRSIDWTNAGDNISQVALRTQADATGKTVAMYSRQSDGSYRCATTVKFADTVLTNAEIEDSIRKSIASAAPNANVDADVQATITYFNGILHRGATYVGMIPQFNLSDQYTLSSLTFKSFDDAGTPINTPSGTTALTGNTQPVNIAASGQTMVKSHYVELDGTDMSPVAATAGDPTGKANSITGSKGTTSATTTPANIAGYRPLTAADLSSLTAAQRATIATTLGTSDSSVAGLTALANKNSGKTIWATSNLSVPYPGENGKSYNSAGNIVASGTAGSSTGWGTTDVYYFYTLATQTLNVHVVQVPCYVNSADATSGKDCDAQPANGTSWQPSDGTEDTSRSETFTGLSGTTATNTLTKYSVQLGGKDHPVSLSAGLQQLAPGTDSKRTINFQLNTTFDMDNNLDQDEYVYIQANPEKDITKTTTRTIHYKLNHNTVDTPPADNVQTITWTQHQIHNVAYDQIDGSPNWDKNAWRTADTGKGLVNMSEVNSPTIPGYIAKTPVVSKIVGLDNMGNGTGYDASGRYEVVYFDPTDPANRNTSDRTLTVNVVYNKTVQRMPFTGGSGILLGTLIALGLLTMAAILTHLRNKRTTK